jgi:hypothetical protein
MRSTIERGGAMRLHCEHCAETYDEDNLNECARCDANTCWKCAIHAELPKRAAGTWWCDRCLNEVGRTDLLKGMRPKPRRVFGIRERFLAAEGLKEMVMKSEPGMLAWPDSDDGRKALTSWLAAVDLDVDEGSPHFDVPPTQLSSDADRLVFTEYGYMRLAIVLTAKPIWLR